MNSFFAKLVHSICSLCGNNIVAPSYSSLLSTVEILTAKIEKQTARIKTLTAENKLLKTNNKGNSKG